MNSPKTYNAEASTSPIQMMSGPVRDLALFLMVEKDFSVGVLTGSEALQIRPLSLAAVISIRQAQEVALSCESLEAILPDAMERFGLSGTRIAWDFICAELVSLPGDSESTIWTRLSFDDWTEWSSDVKLVDHEGKVIPTDQDLGEGDIYHEDLVREESPAG